MRDTPPGEALLDEAGNLFDLMTELFNLPLEEKQKYDFAAKRMYFGYKGKGKEILDASGVKDRNEQYNISKDDILSVSDPLPAPDVITNHRAGLKQYIESNYSIMMTLLDSLSTSLQLPADTLASLHRLNRPSGCHVRFISTPPLEASTPTTHALGGEHTDFGTLTILLNRLGGLQVLLPGSEDWVYVKPVPGCAIVNLGDAMVKFSGGLLRSNLHRVIRPPGEQWRVGRQSLVYFLRPEHEVVLSRLRGGLVEEFGVGEYEGVSSREWLERRHIGRKVEFFKGLESWESLKGTEGRVELVSAN